MDISQILLWVQMTLSVILIASILLQQSEAGLGGVFGGGDSDATRRTRRGFEKTFFNFTIVIAVLWAIVSFSTLLV